MTVLLTIGDFSRMTHLSVKALRHYHDVGLLEPAEVDRASGYRLYDAGQVPVAQVIRRFRDLGMPVDEVKSVLDAPDVTTRNQVIVAHLERMEDQLAQTQATVASLRAVLEAPGVPAPVEYRTVGPTTTLAIREHVTSADLESWWTDAFQTSAQGPRNRRRQAGRPGWLPLPERDVRARRGGNGGLRAGHRPPGRRRPGAGSYELPAVELAIMVHEGSYDDLDQTYGALGTYVAERAIGVEGPIREHYVVSPLDVEDPAGLRTELGWPVFRAG